MQSGTFQKITAAELNRKLRVNNNPTTPQQQQQQPQITSIT